MGMLVTTSDSTPTHLCLQAGKEIFLDFVGLAFERMIQVAITGGLCWSALAYRLGTYVVTKFDPRILDASNILLDNAYLSQADFSGGWLSYASFQNADLSGADLSGANLTWANLVEADLSKANLSKANLNGAYLFDANLNGAYLSEANLEGAELYGVKGLTKEQLEACKAKGAIIDDDATTSAPQPTVAPSPSKPRNNVQAPSTPPAQEITPALDTGESSAPSSSPGQES
jgi:hypothetical protein